MKKLIAIPLLCLMSCFTFGQKVLVFYDVSDKTELNELLETASTKKIGIDTTSNPARFNENTLKNYNAIVFLNTSANRLSFRQAAELQRFIQAGGGFVGNGKAADASYKWLWYENILGGSLAKTQLENPVQLSLITNASIGKTALPPLWKMSDKPLVFNSLPIRCKPVLLDVTGKTWAWYYTTDEGGKLFYTALGCEPSAYKNPDFINHLWSGIEEVSAKTLPDYVRIAGTTLPDEKNFLKIILADNLQKPVALATMRNENVLVVEEEGNVKMYEVQKRKTRLIGKIEVPGLQAIRLDPEFYQNGYIYTFAETAPEGYKIGRMQLVGDTTIAMTDFTSQSTNPLAKNAIYDFERYTRSPYRLPKYFDKKTFRYDNEQGMILETLDEDGNVKNIEPFLTDMRFDFIRDLAFGPDGNLYFLEDNQLKKVDYAEGNRKPIAIASADVLTGNAPLKVKFSSEGSVDFDKNDKISFEWNFDGVNQSTEANPEFTFSKSGTYQVKLKVSDTNGETTETGLEIQVIKPPVKGRKR
ncbi:ThuA domain-containing protein [Emticicia sp. BO119]|uniref:ThuA domain-containing protein n=1 Tax=Emticicia sp. BO119 TaxID=2757768 RepID=UPI0015F00056|nr:ThuA domain-containing protein [Emticicia sp. BO119]MBA4848762.1 ThuA domain-containing protein [Emticicia sp. BO119]